MCGQSLNWMNDNLNPWNKTPSNYEPPPPPPPPPQSGGGGPSYTPAQAIAVSAPVAAAPTSVVKAAPAPSSVVGANATSLGTSMNQRTIRRGNAANTISTSPLGLSGVAPTATKQLLGQ